MSCRETSRPSDKLFAWIESRGDGEHRAGFVSADTMRMRPPAMHACSSDTEGRRWIEDQAVAFGCLIEWVSEPPVMQDFGRSNP